MARLVNGRLLLAISAVSVGVVTVLIGARLETRNPRTEREDGIAWLVLAGGTCLIGAGVGLTINRSNYLTLAEVSSTVGQAESPPSSWSPAVVVLSAIAFPVAAFCLLEVGFWTLFLLSGWPRQDQMVPSGYAMIPEAKQIDDLLGPAQHAVRNYKEPDIAEWETEVFFGGRYELEMSVGVRVDRSSGRVIEVIGQPHFLLLEIQSIHDREATYRQAGQHEFGPDQWRQVVNAGGDFSVIGIQLNRNNPVPGFDRYQAIEAEFGIRMRDNDKPVPAPAGN